MVNYWDKYTEMHGQRNVKTLHQVLLQLPVAIVLKLIPQGHSKMRPQIKEWGEEEPSVILSIKDM